MTISLERIKELQGMNLKEGTPINVIFGCLKRKTLYFKDIKGPDKKENLGVKDYSLVFYLKPGKSVSVDYNMGMIKKITVDDKYRRDK